MLRHGRDSLVNSLTSHYSLAVWLTSSLGLAKLAAQFHFYHFNMVSDLIGIGFSSSQISKTLKSVDNILKINL